MTSSRLTRDRRRLSSRRIGRPAEGAHGPPPSRPGAFRVEDVPPPPGRYRWALLLDGPGLSDRHDLGTITVFADEAAARAHAEQQPPEDAAAIAHLKEPQWSSDFATAWCRKPKHGRQSVRPPRSIRFLAAKRSSQRRRRAASARPSCCRSAIASARARSSDRSSRGSRLARPRNTRGRSCRSEGLLKPPASRRHVPNGCSRIAQCQRDEEDANRTLVVAEARLSAAEARLAQRMKRSEPVAGGRRQRVCPARAHWRTSGRSDGYLGRGI